ncbi:MAG: sugar-transfer associated ATP-grasp domain-containing protein [Bacteroides sp.]
MAANSKNQPGERHSRVDAVHDRLVDWARTWGPLALIATLLTAAGLLVDETVTPLVFEDSRIFFQIVLAGAVMALLRNEVGLQTYGLFAPAIIAFILVDVGLVWGLILFVNLLVVTLVAYRALRPLQLGTAPRVAVLLSVAGLVTALMFVAADVGLLPSLTTSGQVFFPTVISAWYADRAASDIEERGWRVPSKRLLGTLVAVVLAYAVISRAALVDWFIATPVAWGLTLLLVAYVGSRPSLRMSEFRRFSGHTDGEVGSLSLAVVRLRLWLTRFGRTIARRVGLDVDESTRSVRTVLAMKRRNKYIEAYNPPHLRPSADEKADVNRRLTGLDIASPRTYAVIDDHADLDVAHRIVDEYDEFVVKPSNGYGGEGIVVVSGCNGDVYETSKGRLTEHDLVGHVRRIVDGHYSGLESDGAAIIEEKLTPATFMRELHGDGVADVRVIVFQGYPVMAMTRLPTAESDGAANLHLGAVGVGLSVADGTPLKAFQQSRDRELDAHPDTGASLTDFQLPNWDDVVEIAVAAAAASGLGYTGVDVVLTEGNIPKVLEVNVRPGLGIQNATGEGLFRRLAFVEALPAEYEYLPTAKKIRLAQEWDAAGYDEAARPDADELHETSATTSETDEATTASTAMGADGTAEPTDHPVEDRDDDRGRRTDGRSDTDESTDGIRSRLLILGGGLVSGALLIGSLMAGFPVVTGIFVLVAVGFVGGLCWEAFGPQELNSGERE